MVDTDLILETITVIFLSIYYTLEGIVKKVLPARFLPQKDISKDTVLVTGAGSGIGRGLAISLAKIGCKLVVWDVNEESNLETASEIKKFGGQAFAYTVDVCKREEVYSVAEKVLAEVGPVDILINNAGVATGTSFLQYPDSLIQKTMDVNVMAHFWTLKAFLPSMIERDYGHIVSISSLSGLIASNGMASYCASKFASIGLFESISLELKCSKRNVKTTLICPGSVKTPMLESFKVKYKFPSLVPIMELDYVVRRIVECILTNREVLYLPESLLFYLVARSLQPTKVNDVQTDYLGLMEQIGAGNMPSSS